MHSTHADDESTSQPAKLEASLLRAIGRRYACENRLRFGGQLERPIFALTDATTSLGRWTGGGARRLEVSRKLAFERPWLDVVSALEQAMAQQFVEEVLRVTDEPAHGPTFRKVCAERGIPTGTPAAGAFDLGRVEERVRKLLALAGSPNAHEAELALNKAHELMQRHNLTTGATEATERYEVRHLGDPRTRRTFVETVISSLLSELFRVEQIRMPVHVAELGRAGEVFEIVGTRANVAMASHTYAFLLATAERLWNDHRRAARLRGSRDRIEYQTGVIMGFLENLRAKRLGSSQTGLACTGADDLSRFCDARYPSISVVQHSVTSGAAHIAGDESGRQVALHTPIDEHAAAEGAFLHA